MLRTAFIGNDNAFDRKVCEWLAQYTDLRLIIWTNSMSWSSGRGRGAIRKRLNRFWHRCRRHGALRTADEILYFLFYRSFYAKAEQRRLRELVNSVSFEPTVPLQRVRQIRPNDIRSEQLLEDIRTEGLDAMFAMCIDVYLPTRIIEAPRHGTFLWHEGITPEYRGVHSPFWVLANGDYDNLGYTLLKMNAKLDAGDVYIQGRVNGVDPNRDLHCYIGHKSIFESLSRVRHFLIDLESGTHKSLDRSSAVDGYYSYPTGTALLKIIIRRAKRRVFGQLSMEGRSNGHPDVDEGEDSKTRAPLNEKSHRCLARPQQRSR